MSQRLNYNAVSPTGMKTLGTVYDYVQRSGLPSRLVDLVFLRVSQINGCAYCIDMHSRDLLEMGLPVEHLVAVWPEAGTIFTEPERAALAWAEGVTRLADRGVPDSAFEAAVAALGEQQLVDLTLAVSLMNAYNRLATASGRRPPRWPSRMRRPMECAQPEGKCPDQKLSSGQKSRFAAREYDKRPRQWIERAHFPNPLRCLSRPIGYAMRGLSPGSSLLAARLVSRVENVLGALRRFNSRLARVL